VWVVAARHDEQVDAPGRVHRILDPRELFRKMRENPLKPLIQINHPRWVGIQGGYFRELDLSPAAGDPQNPLYSGNFDSFEILNDNSVGGWELRLPPTGSMPDFDHSVRDDWFNLLNRGFSYAGVGNSDSHNVEEAIGGCPRNFVISSTDDPTKAVERELVEGVRAKRVSVSSGIFVTMAAATKDGNLALGSTVKSRGGEVALQITVQAAPWIDADRLVLIGNGEPVFTAELQGSDPSVAQSTAGRPVVRFKDTVRVQPRVDTWYLAYAVGDEPPYPMLHKVTVPLGFTNPIWVD